MPSTTELSSPVTPATATSATVSPMIGGGGMAQRVREFDWTATALSEPGAWPQALTTLVQVVLGSNQPMFVAWGPSHVLIYNDAYTDILAAKHPSALGQPLLDVWDEIRSGLIPLIEQTYSGNAVVMPDIQFLLQRKGYPEEAHFAFSYTPVHGPEGQISGFFCACTETTRQVVADRKEKRSRARLDGALAVARLGAFEWYPQTGVVEVDARCREMFGLPAEGVIHADDIFSCIVPDDLARVHPEAMQAVRLALLDAHGHEHRYDAEYDIVRPDGERRSILSTGHCVLEPDGTLRMLGAFHDVTNIKRAEAQLREQNATLEQRVAERTRERDRTWNLSHDLLAIIDHTGIFTAVSPAAMKILGWAPAEMVGRSAFDFIHPDDQRSSTEVLAVAIEREIPTFENRYRHKDGSYRWLSWSAAPHNDFLYATGRNVTAEKEQASALAAAEEALRQSQKLEAIGQLTGGVAHDFNNLLTVIKSSTDLLKRPDLPDERRQRYVAAISDTVDRAAKLTGQLLAFARRQALKPEVFDAVESVRAISDMMGTLTGSRVRIVTQLPDAPCFLDADPSQFDTALVNMAVNARDAMDGEGQLTICVETVAQMPVVRAHAAVHGAFVAVSVIDTGSGIPEERLDQIFEPFFTTKEVGQGTGLGLSQVFGFAKQSGGEVSVRSTVGKGSTFTLYLPRVETTTQVAATHEPENLMDGHGTCVLVVEDNVDVGTFAVQTLRDLGYVTVWASNAEEALTELERDADRFDVVFTDVVMPGMNGIDLAHEIRRQHHDLPVLLASGYSHVLAQNGTYGFELLHKPYSIENLSRLLRKVATWQRRKRIMGT